MMIPTIPTPDELLNKGFSRGKKAADLLRGQKIPKHLKGKRIEERRVGRNRAEVFPAFCDSVGAFGAGGHFKRCGCDGRVLKPQ